MEEVPVHPVQALTRNRRPATAPQVVTLRAYEVYKRVCGEQEALITGDCRGGFGVGELIGFLYARSFPESEWRQRFDEAMTGLHVD
jgi:hypothetical protein